jgi:hypothetical protein
MNEPDRKSPTRPDEIVFDRRTARIQFDDVIYTLRGVSPQVVAFLRVPLRVEKGGSSHLDRVDLSSARARRKFAESASRKLAVSPAQVEEQLLSILEVLSEREREELEKSDRPLFAQAPKLSEAERESALAYLAQPDLLGAIEEDLGKLGYVGEGQAKRLVFLVALSRKLERPLAAILRSSSGSGKSALLELVTRVSPPEDVVFLSELTPQALYYLDPGALKHKLLVVDERAGSERADYPIRTLLSHQALSLAVTISDPASGQRRTKLVEVQGPVGYLESTTVPVLNPENTSRALEVFLDESSEQTRRIQEAQRRRRMGGASSPAEDALVALHRNVQRCLSISRVEIPFAMHLSFPSELPRHRRDHEKFLRLIESVTLFHQHRRERRDEALLATLEDYRLAYDLARPILVRSSETLSVPAREALAMLRDREILEFARRDVARELGWSPMKVWRILGELVRADFVVPLSRKNGVRRTYRVVEYFSDPTGETRLVPPDELARRLGVS